MKNLVKNLDGDCHICAGKLQEIVMQHSPHIRILCLNCKTNADAHTHGHAYILYSSLK